MPLGVGGMVHLDKVGKEVNQTHSNLQAGVSFLDVQSRMGTRDSLT